MYIVKSSQKTVAEKELELMKTEIPDLQLRNHVVPSTTPEMDLTGLVEKMKTRQTWRQSWDQVVEALSWRKHGSSEAQHGYYRGTEKQGQCRATAGLQLNTETGQRGNSRIKETGLANLVTSHLC